jgi:hypothetical protein
MHFLGLGFGQLAAIFGAVGGAVVVLYILKLRRRPVPIPFSPLWSRILKDKDATSLFSRLKRLLSLLLQLALLLLLVLALGDPRTAIEAVKGRNLVVLVDTSASMQAAEGGPSNGRARIDQAKDELRKLVRGLGASDRMLIATMDTAITPLSPMTGDSARLEAAVDDVRPTDTHADLARGLRFAMDTLRGTKEPEVVVLSDGVLPEARDALGPVKLGDVKLSFIPVGKGMRNVAITQFSVRRYPLDRARYEVMLEVQNLGDRDEQIDLSLYGDGVLVDVTKLAIQSANHCAQTNPTCNVLPRFYPNLGGASRTLKAELAVSTPDLPKHDDLTADDVAYAVLPERRRTKVLAVTPGNTYLEAALLLDEYLDVTTTTPSHMGDALSKAKFDVAIYDGVTPALRPGMPALYLDPHGDDGPVKVDEKKPIDEPSFDKLERKHPILRWTALDAVNIGVARKLTPQEGDKIVGASDEGPILVAGQRNSTKFVVLGFDVRQSDFPLRIAWPVFLLNCINWFVEEDAEYLSSFRTGEVWHVPAPVGVQSSVVLIDPDEKHHTVPVQEGRAVFFGTRAGFYRLQPPVGAVGPDGEHRADVMFAANLVDPTESAIAPKSELTVDDRKGTAVEGFHVGVRRELWIYLLVIVVIVSAIEWATYHRRITV